MKQKYKRVLIKLSGEALLGDRSHGIDPEKAAWIACEIKKAYQLGVELALVVGGGNIWRGLSAASRGMDRVTADYMGMLATVINALALQNALEREKIRTRVMTAIEIAKLAEPYIRRRAIRHLEKGRVVIFAGGTGNPYFTTDTTSALRAVEINAQIIFKATKVDGVYTSDPMINKRAKIFRKISYMEALKRRLKVMDSTALSLCMDNDLPITVFNLNKAGNIRKAVLGQAIGTRIGGHHG